jgi:hypothetical protein
MKSEKIRSGILYERDIKVAHKLKSDEKKALKNKNKNQS